ncbi:MAG TPA: response regulator transcription factor [Solirubrobacterales bacterium]|nr:response regulator transcription factor [Solirubrobacterales bacterium]
MDVPTILVIEDDSDIRGLVATLALRAGMDPVEAADGRAGVRLFFERRPRLVVLDLGLPELDGWQVLERIRELSAVPILVLTATDASAQKVRGLDLGADDYVTKPFDPDELIARCRALLRRAETGSGEHEVLSDDVITLDERRRRVQAGDAEIALTPTEFKLLATLMRNRDQVLTQEQLLESVWGNAGGDPKQVRLYVSYLRRKLREAGGVEPIETVRGFGYRFQPAILRP